MRSVYSFSRTAEETVAALSRVFSAGGPAREQLSLHAEMLVEPVGWDAIWKLSKEFCKKFDEVRFPCVARVTVSSVDFETLSASVEVLSVQDKSVSLPESVQDVPLIELWPTIKQQEQCIDVATTAEFIDLMRFFYNNLWMPWDDQDDKVLLPNTIEERMELWQQINNGTIPNWVAREITLLRNSAIDAHHRLQELDSSLCEDDANDDDDSLLPPNYLALCAELTAKLEAHQAKWTLYEKALIRQHYLAKETHKWQKNKSRKNVVALWQGGSPYEFAQISQHLQANLRKEHTLTITPSAEQALALEPEELVVCSEECELPEISVHHIIISSVKGLSEQRRRLTESRDKLRIDTLYSDIMWADLWDIEQMKPMHETQAGVVYSLQVHSSCIESSDMRSCLLQLSDECYLRGLALHCSRVNTVLVARPGNAHIQRCNIKDDQSGSQNNFAQGLVAMPDARVLIEDTTFDHFYTGLVVHKGARVELKNCVIKNCGVGIQMYSGAEVKLVDCTVAQCSENCIRYEMDKAFNESHGLVGLSVGNSTIGDGDLRKEVEIIQQDIDFM